MSCDASWRWSNGHHGGHGHGHGHGGGKVNNNVCHASSCPYIPRRHRSFLRSQLGQLDMWDQVMREMAGQQDSKPVEVIHNHYDHHHHHHPGHPPFHHPGHLSTFSSVPIDSCSWNKCKGY